MNRRKEESLRAEDTTTAVNLGGRVVGVSMTKPSISIGSLPDLPLVPQSHGLDLGKQCVSVSVFVCLHSSAHIISKLMKLSHSWYTVLQLSVHPTQRNE